MLRRSFFPAAALAAAAAATTNVGTTARRPQSHMWSYEPPTQEIAPTNKALKGAQTFGDEVTRHQSVGRAAGAAPAMTRLMEHDAKFGRGESFKWERGDAADEAGDDTAQMRERHAKGARRYDDRSESDWWASRKPQMIDEEGNESKRDARNRAGEPKEWSLRGGIKSADELKTTGFPEPRVTFVASGSSWTAQRGPEGEWTGSGRTWEVPAAAPTVDAKGETPEIKGIIRDYELNPKTMAFEPKTVTALPKEGKKGFKLLGKKEGKAGKRKLASNEAWAIRSRDTRGDKRKLSSSKENSFYQAERAAKAQEEEALRRLKDFETGSHTARPIEGSGTGAKLAMQLAADHLKRQVVNNRASKHDSTGNWDAASSRLRKGSASDDMDAGLGIRLEKAPKPSSSSVKKHKAEAGWSLSSFGTKKASPGKN